jgi:putative ABC transport system permease protein
MSPLAALQLDLRYAVRGLLRRGRSSWLTVILLSLGIGLPTAMFSIVDGVVLRGLPVPQGERIVRVTTYRGFDAPMPAEDFLQLREQQEVFAAVAAYRPSLNSVVTHPGIGSKGLPATFVTGNLFRLLGVEPVMGRQFTLEDEDPAAPSVAMISYGVWQTQFGGDRDVLGKTVVINREPMTLVGVMPPGFRFPTQEKAWSVVHWQGRPWSQGPVFGIGILRPGMRPDDAASQLEPLIARWDQARPLEEARQLHVRRFVEAYLSPELIEALDLLLAAVLAVALLASVNVASLRLGDSLARDDELAVRRTLGARAGQLLRLLVVEALVLTAISAAAGLALAGLLLRLVSDRLIAGSPVARLFWVDPGLDLRACLFAAAVAACAVLVGGLLPSLWSLRRRRLATGSRATLGPGAVRVTNLLVAGQVAISFVLIASSVVLVGSGIKLLAQQPAFDGGNLMRALVTTYQADRETEEAQRAFWLPLLDRLRSHPEIASVTAASGVPWGQTLGIGSAPVQPTVGEVDPSTAQRAELLFVLPGFFDTLRLPLLSGRKFDQTDVAAVESDTTTELPVIVSASFARRHFPDGPHLGRQFSFLLSARSSPSIAARIVGVVADRGLARSDQPHAEETIYAPLSLAQHGGGFLIVRGRGGTEGLIREIDREIAKIDARVATLDDRTFGEERAEMLWVERRLAELFSAFALTAVVLAFGGLFGSVLLSFQRRRKELAIRAVLGAAPHSLRRLMLWDGGRSVVLGVLVGVVSTLFGDRLLGAFLHDVQILDPVVLVATAVGVLVVLSPALLGPARRAARTAPAASLGTD